MSVLYIFSISYFYISLQTGVSKCIAEMYKSLPAKRKQKYVDMAAIHRREYEEKLEDF